MVYSLSTSNVGHSKTFCEVTFLFHFLKQHPQILTTNFRFTMIWTFTVPH